MFCSGSNRSIEETERAFATTRYAFLPSFLEPQQAAELYQYVLTLLAAGEMKWDFQVLGTPSQYAEPRIERLLLRLQPRIEALSGLKLYPTYSYVRVYAHDDVLTKHRDRPACEISVSLALGFKAEISWPLWIEGPCGIAAVRMQPGDAVLYRGVECWHWRDRFPGEHAVQCFLHYVDQNGENADWKFDKREVLNVGQDCGGSVMSMSTPHRNDSFGNDENS
jgi:hypothetical protein